MATIETHQSGVRDAFAQAANGGKPAVLRTSSAPDGTSKSNNSGGGTDRTVHDTVTLSEGGQKIVNLHRAQDLAQDLKTAPVDTAFADTLKQATNDVFRITQLFAETIKSAFSGFRSSQ